MADVKQAASLSPTQRIKSNAIPLVAGMSFMCGCPSSSLARFESNDGNVAGLFATFAIEKGMKSKNRHAAGDIVDHWNHVWCCFSRVAFGLLTLL